MNRTEFTREQLDHFIDAYSVHVPNNKDVEIFYAQVQHGPLKIVYLEDPAEWNDSEWNDSLVQICNELFAKQDDIDSILFPTK